MLNRLIDELTSISKNIIVGVTLTLLLFFLLNTIADNAEVISALMFNFGK